MWFSACSFVRYSFPLCPYFRVVAAGSLFSVSDDGSSHQLGIVKHLVLFCPNIVSIFQEKQIRIFAVPVNELVDATQSSENGIKFAPGHSVADQVNALIGDTPLLEISFSLFGIKALSGAENLNVQYSTSMRVNPCGGTV